MLLLSLTGNVHARIMLNTPLLSKPVDIEFIVLLTLEHLPSRQLFIDFISEAAHKDFSIYADANLVSMIIKLGYGLAISTVSCMNFISAIITYLQENPPTVASHVNAVHDVNNNALNIDDDLVVNLSQHILTDAQRKLHSRGLKFCPNPGEPDFSSYQTDLDKFHLRLKRFLHFHRPKRIENRNENSDLTQIPASNTQLYSDSQSNQPFEHQKFKNPSPWVPPPIVALEFFISKNKLDLVECKVPTPWKSNISPEENLSIRQLANNPNVIIKPADKGGAVVLQDRHSYIQEGMQQLSDANFYREVKTDLSKQHHQEIIQILDEMLSQGQIDRSCYLYLTDDRIRTAQFYMLPKIHKNRTHPPGRPIVSGNGCPTERISQFIVHILQPKVKNIRSYIKDTSDFLYMLNGLGK